jgi:hypothetical protein
MARWLVMTPELVEWEPSFRIIPSRFPPINLFETVTDPRDYDAVCALESMTNPRLRDEMGTLDLVPREDRISGVGSSPIMAAFTHLNPAGSRFSDGTFGVYYCAKDLETAIMETIHHLVIRLRETNEPPQHLDMRVIHANLTAHMVPLNSKDHANLLKPDSYADSQVFGRELRKAGLDGIHYPSVRYQGGECAAAFRPRLLSPCLQTKHLAYPWNGRDIQRSGIYVKSELPPPDGTFT